MSGLFSLKCLSFVGCLLGMGTAAFAGGPPTPATPPSTGIAAIWSQIVGHGVDAKNPDYKTLSSFQPPNVELRFILAGNSRSCGEYSIWHRSSFGGKWMKSATKAKVRKHSTVNDGFDWKGNFPMTLCRVVTDKTWFDAGVSSSSTSFTPVTIWSPPASAIGSRKAVVKSQVAAAGSIGHQNPGRDEIVMVTLGDTGCRGVPSGEHGRKLQRCKANGQHQNQWFFPELMEKVSKVSLDNGTSGKPDFFIHVGDYRYFWEDYNDNGRHKHSVDSLGFWLQEFLTPAQEALTIAPWALVRGNHEVCWGANQWYGHGWRYLFGNADWPDISCNDLVPTAYFDVGPKGGKYPKTHHRVVIFDNSDPGTFRSQDRLDEAVAATYGPNGAPYVASNHWASHVPSVAYMSYCKGQCGNDGRNTQNDTALNRVQTALGKFGKGPICQDRGKRMPRCVPSTLFAGHQHFFERIRLWEKDAAGNNVWAWPQMYVVGHGGTKKDGTGLGTDTKCRTKLGLPSTSKAKYESEVWADIRHGFVAWRRAADTVSNPSGWAEKQYWHTSGTINNQGKCPTW